MSHLTGKPYLDFQKVLFGSSSFVQLLPIAFSNPNRDLQINIKQYNHFLRMRELISIFSNEIGKKNISSNNSVLKVLSLYFFFLDPLNCLQGSGD